MSRVVFVVNIDRGTVTLYKMRPNLQHQHSHRCCAFASHWLLAQVKLQSRADSR